MKMMTMALPRNFEDDEGTHKGTSSSSSSSRAEEIKIRDSIHGAIHGEQIILSSRRVCLACIGFIPWGSHAWTSRLFNDDDDACVQLAATTNSHHSFYSMKTLMATTYPFTSRSGYSIIG